MNYFFWQNNREPGEALIYSGWPHSIEASFITGNLISSSLPEIEITMNEKSQGRLTDNVLMTGRGRVFSNTLIQLLNECGVNNIEAFPCQIKNLVTGEIHLEYSAANIIGKIACVDPSASRFEDFGDDSNRILAWDYLMLNEEVILGQKLFVLAEMPVQIVVHSDIVEVLKKNGVSGVEFIPQGDNAFNATVDDL